MSIDLARQLASALDVRSETRIRSIDRVLSAYARLTPQSEVVPIQGAIDASQVISGTFDDARVAESNVTQHEAALAITEIQITDLGNYPELDQGETISGDWTFSSQIRLPNYTTGSRPTAIGVGVAIFDTTLGIPIWWDGSNWIDATGATV